MRKDGSGNLIFERGVFDDISAMSLIHHANQVALVTRRDEDKIQRRILARAMVDAGLTPPEDLADTEPMLLYSRAEAFLRSYLPSALVVVRADEIEEICESLRTEPQDRDLPGQDRYHGERSELAGKLAQTIEDLQPGEAADTAPFYIPPSGL